MLVNIFFSSTMSQTFPFLKAMEEEGVRVKEDCLDSLYDKDDHRTYNQLNGVSQRKGLGRKNRTGRILT